MPVPYFQPLPAPVIPGQGMANALLAGTLYRDKREQNALTNKLAERKMALAEKTAENTAALNRVKLYGSAISKALDAKDPEGAAWIYKRLTGEEANFDFLADDVTIETPTLKIQGKRGTVSEIAQGAQENPNFFSDPARLQSAVPWMARNGVTHFEIKPYQAGTREQQMEDTREKAEIKGQVGAKYRKPDKTLDEIESEAAARARGTASVAKKLTPAQRLAEQSRMRNFLARRWGENEFASLDERTQQNIFESVVEARKLYEDQGYNADEAMDAAFRAVKAKSILADIPEADPDTGILDIGNEEQTAAGITKLKDLLPDAAILRGLLAKGWTEGQARKIMEKAGISEPSKAAALPQGLTEEDVRFNMEKYGKTRQEVIDAFKARR